MYYTYDTVRLAAIQMGGRDAIYSCRVNDIGKSDEGTIACGDGDIQDEFVRKRLSCQTVVLEQCFVGEDSLC